MKKFNFILMLLSGILMLTSGSVILPLLVAGLDVNNELFVLIISSIIFVFAYTIRKQFD